MHNLSKQISKGFDTWKSTGMILIDLQKGFENLGLRILLKKFKCIVFSPEIVRWFRSYLTKNLIISLDKSLSEPCHFHIGSYVCPIQFVVARK